MNLMVACGGAGRVVVAVTVAVAAAAALVGGGCVRGIRLGACPPALDESAETHLLVGVELGAHAAEVHGSARLHAGGVIGHRHFDRPRIEGCLLLGSGSDGGGRWRYAAAVSGGCAMGEGWRASSGRAGCGHVD